MSNKNDFLFEIGTEELPPKDLSRLMNALVENIRTRLKLLGVKDRNINIKGYAAPRRLAIHITQLENMSPEMNGTRKGPAVNAAFDAQGKPTKACEGFARSCGVNVDQLVQDEDGAYMLYHFVEPCKSIHEFMPPIIEAALAALPVAKTMRWGSHSTAFVRPIHWMVMLYGSEIINVTIMGFCTGNTTYGHRFHAPQAIVIGHASDYETVLEKNGKVIADFKEREDLIKQGINQLANDNFGEAVIDPALLSEVAALVEWPVPLLANFEQRFLDVPKEALISSMQGHQKCFPVIDKQGKLLPYFITVSNIESKDAVQVIVGYERVMRARLSDAAFFYQTDLKTKLAERCDGLKNVTFQAKLGSIFDKSQRIASLAALIAQRIGADASIAKRAGELCKADLLSAMVNEFPELQGIMGEYYARHDKEPEQVAIAIREHYLPRSATDDLPKTLEGCATALADRFDTLVGLFGINQPPTGDKDPFALRRAAVGILKIIIQNKLNITLSEILVAAVKAYNQILSNGEAAKQAHEFILERLRAYYQEQGVSVDNLFAVLAVQNENPLDINRRVIAVQNFRQLSEAAALAAANKRVSNILAKLSSTPEKIDEALFETEQEKTLYRLIKTERQITSGTGTDIYTQQLQALAALQKPIDGFFDHVMVMVDNPKIQSNRLALLNAMRNLFLQVADISLLQIER